jgi:hypothetical protein
MPDWLPGNFREILTPWCGRRSLIGPHNYGIINIIRGNKAMNVWIGQKTLDILDVAVAAEPSARRLLSGHSEAADPVHVDVHIRSYDDSAPLAAPVPRSQPGRLPIGTLLDCYA